MCQFILKCRLPNSYVLSVPWVDYTPKYLYVTKFKSTHLLTNIIESSQKIYMPPLYILTLMRH